jgi:hypothetical protein
MTDGQSASLSWNKAPIWGIRPDFITVRQLRVCWCGALSLTRGRVCRLQLLLVVNAVILGFEFRGTRYHTLLSKIRDFPLLRLLQPAGLRFRYSNQSNGIESSRVESYVTTDGQSASISWNKTPIWGLWPDFYYCQSVAGLLMWGVLSDERLLLVLASAVIPGSESCGTRDHILLSKIRDFPFCRLLWLAGLRWRYLIPPPNGVLATESEPYITTDGLSASLSWNKARIWGLRPDWYYCQTVAGLLTWGALSDEKTSTWFAVVAGLASAVTLGSESRGTRDHFNRTTLAWKLYII